MTNTGKKKRNKSQAKTTREMAFLALYEVLEKEAFSHLVIKHTLEKYPEIEERDRAFLMRLIRGTIEYVITIDTILDYFSKVKVKKMKPVIRTILRMSVYQLKYMDTVPAHAVCNEAVRITIWQGLTGLKGYVNGVLRNISREMDKMPEIDKEQKPIEYLSNTYSVPRWMVENFVDNYGVMTATQILMAQSEPELVSVWCNTLCQPLEELYQKLQQEGLEPEALPYQLSGFYLRKVNHLEKSKSFMEGAFLIQDVSSMIAGEVAAPEKNNMVLDVCAAPGGKTLHAAIMMQDTGQIYASDLTESKVALIEQTIIRTGLNNIQTVVQDARTLKPELISKMDVVIADLPCSGLGIIGRKPEIKYRIKRESILELAALQREILSVIWQYVKPGGRLIYSTCTMTSEENQENYEWLLENSKMTRESLNGYLPEELHNTTTEQGFLQLLPGVHKCDGFFIASAQRPVN